MQGSERCLPHLSPNTLFPYPAKALALGTRVRDEGNCLPALQEFTAWMGR